MIWVAVFGGIALAGLVVVVAYGIWLWHKATDLFSELQMLGVRAGEFADLAGQIKPTSPQPGRE